MQNNVILASDAGDGAVRHEIVFLDAAIDGHAQLAAALPAGAELHLLDGGLDGLTQILDILAGRTDVDAVHVISHGAQGLLKLGASYLDAAALSERADEIASIRSVMSSDGDILFYGCDVGAGVEGVRFLSSLAALTGADVAASTDATGALAAGGNWVLESRIGTIDSASVLSGGAAGFAGTLAVPGDEDYEDDDADFASVASPRDLDGFRYNLDGGGETWLADASTYPVVSGNAMYLNASGWNGVNYFTLSSTTGDNFALHSLLLESGGGDASTTFTIEGYSGGINGSLVASDTLDLAASDESGSVTYARSGVTVTDGGTLTFGADWNNIDTIVFHATNGTGIAMVLDAIDVSAPAAPAASITSATYDAATGILTVTAAGMTPGDTIDVGKLTLIGEGGGAVTLTSSNVTAASATAFSVALNPADKAAVTSLLNKAGTASTGGTTYNLAAAANWNATAGSPADATGNGVTVSNVAAPTITSATYDAASGHLVVSGTGLLKLAGAANDIIASRFTLTGEGGATYTLASTSNVEITSSTSFTLALSAADRAGVNAIANKNGVASTTGTSYNLAAAEDWAAGADAAVVVADPAGNGVTVSNVAAPTITSATYDAATGALVVTGTGFLSRGGTANDIVASKFTLTGEGGATYTLTDSADVEITSGTSFTLMLSATDRAAVNGIVNRNGTASTGGTTYNLAAAEDWAAGADAAVVVADTTGNGVTVSNVAVPTITSATYDAATGMLVVTGTGFLSRGGTANDIVASKFTLTGEGGATYTLTDSADVDITSGTSFTLALSATDRAAFDAIVNRNGTASTGGTTYNLAAAEDWAAGANAAVVVADTTGNGVTVSNVAVPTITSATYDAATGTLVVTGAGFLGRGGAANDIVASKFTLAGEGGATYTLTNSSNVDITSGTSFTLTLSATDRAGFNAIANKNGVASTTGTSYNLAAAEDWAAGADAAVVVADTAGNGVTVSNVAAPTITSATYDAATGALVVTGTGLLSRGGAANDIVASKFTFTGEGGATYTLTDSADVDITSGTSLTLMLSANDRAALESLLTRNGAAALDATPYALAAAEDWAAGADAAVAVADLTGNGVVVSNAAGPVITGATYDAATHVLTVTGQRFQASAGTLNDVAVSQLTLTGEGGASYTLTSGDVEIADATSFSVTLNAADQLAVGGLLNKDGTAADDGVVYNLAAADNWMPAEALGADLSGNAVTVANTPVPTITSATYDAATGALVVTATGLAHRAGAANDIVAGKFTISGEGGASRTLTSTADVDITSGGAFTLTLSGADKAAVDAIVNRNGASSTGGAVYNLAAAEDWAAGAGASAVIADTTGNGVTASNVAVPAITSATYDGGAGTLTVTGTGFLALAGAGNDIAAGRFTLTGQGGAARTLLDTADVDITSATSFTLHLGAADRAALEAIIDKNGTASTGGATYNLAAAEDWAAGADASVPVADLAGNAITASGVGVPSITSATYDAATGALVVTGSRFVGLAGASNDVVASRFTITGNGGATHTLSDTANAEIASATGFTLMLGATDRAAVAQLLDKNGASAWDATVYNLAAAEDWMAGADAADAIADAGGNGITVGNVAPPAITSSTYDAATGVLSVTGTGLHGVAGAANDILAGKFTFAGEGGATHTLTGTADVDITSGTTFALTLSASDRAAVNLIVNRNGTVSSGGAAYVLHAADDWTAGADAAANIADAGNPVTVANVPTPTITAATYDAGTGMLVVSGANLTRLAGAANDIVASKFTLTGNGGATYTLTDTANVEIGSSATFTLRLSATDKAAVDLLLDRAGTSSTGGTTYNLAAAEDWAAGADASAVVADTDGNGVTVSIPAPDTPAPTPAPAPTTVDGVTVQTAAGTDAVTGMPVATITVPVTTPARADDQNSANPTLADIPLNVGSGADRIEMTISLPTGTGFQAEGPMAPLSNAQALLDLIRRIESKTTPGSAVQADMKGDGTSFLGALAPDVMLQTRTVVVSAAPGASLERPILIDGGAGNGAGKAIGLVIDASGLPAGAVMELNGIDFAAVVGDATLRGGAGRNYVVGDDARQTIFLGEDDDTLSGGGGGDVVGSAGGDDLIDGGDGDDITFGGVGNDLVAGGAGRDSVQGGASDLGNWRFMLDRDGNVRATLDSTLTGASVTQDLSAGQLVTTAAPLRFVSADPEKLKVLALLYHAAFERVPDLPGLSGWATSTLDTAALARGFVESAEWQARFGAMDDHAFVTALYRTALGREPDAAGYAFWTGLLDSKQVTRAGVLEGFALSDEHVAGVATPAGFVLGNETVQREQGWIAGSGDDTLVGGAGDDLLVGGDGFDTAVFAGERADYRFLLERDGTLRVAGPAALDGTDTLHQIEQARFADGTMDLTFSAAPPAALREVGMMYHLVLGRAADLGGLNDWLGSGMDRVALAEGFLQSDEFRQLGPLDDHAFVALLARHAYGESPDAATQRVWEQYLATHARAELVGAMMDDVAIVGAQFGADGLWLV